MYPPVTLPFLHALNDNAAYNRILFLSLLDEYDVKGKLSGKGMTSKDNQPIDIIGYFIQRLGYSLRKHWDLCEFHGYQECTLQVACFALNVKTTHIIYEIDRQGSTNESIRDVTRKIFLEAPLTPRVEYIFNWYSRSYHGPMSWKYDLTLHPE
jgi:hypothetical protein